MDVCFRQDGWVNLCMCYNLYAVTKCWLGSFYLAHGVWEDDEGCEPISIHTENHGDCGQHQQTEAGDWPGRHLPCPYFCFT